MGASEGTLFLTGILTKGGVFFITSHRPGEGWNRTHLLDNNCYPKSLFKITVKMEKLNYVVFQMPDISSDCLFKVQG
jgi:hypothetical protein